MRTRIQLQLMCFVAVTTPNMAAWVAQTCLWLLCNKITLIHSSAFIGISLKMLYLINTRNMEHERLGAQKFTTEFLRVYNASYKRYFNASIGCKIHFSSVFRPFIFALLFEFHITFVQLSSCIPTARLVLAVALQRHREWHHAAKFLRRSCFSNKPE